MEDKIEKLKKFLQENYPNIQAYNTRNIAGDYMENVYNEDNIQVDYAPGYDYIEIFGLSDKEFESLIDEKGLLKTFSEYKKQNKIDLQVGDRITHKSIEEPNEEAKEYIIKDEHQLADIIGYAVNNEIEILKIERPKYEVIEEKKELLTEEEKEFLKLYMKFTHVITDKIYRKDGFICFEGYTTELALYEGFNELIENKSYTLKELGLD